MASNFYQILQANEAASQETLQILFEQQSVRLRQELEDGSPVAKEQMWFLKQAYETLSHPAKREAYDIKIKSKPAVNINSRQATVKTEGLSWKANALMLILLASGLVGFGLYLGRADTKDERALRVLQTNKSAENDATRAGTERVLVEGVVTNDSKLIDRSAELGNRSLNIQQDAENRRRQELEYRANAGAEVLRLEQERLRIADEQLKWERKQREDEKRITEEHHRRAMYQMDEVRRKMGRF